MSSQHLSDEAVAACADGVLTGYARDRATRHISGCPECAYAVKVQREAAWVLRAAPAPAMPTGLLDRLRTVPQTTPITTLPTALAPDGSTMLSTMGTAAAFVAPARQPATHRMRPIVTAAAVVALAGALTAGSVAHAAETDHTGTTQHARHTDPQGPGAITPVSAFFEGTGH